MKRVHGDKVGHQSSRPKTKKNCRRATCSMSSLLLSCFLCLSFWPQASQVMFASDDCNKVTMCCHLTALPSSLYLQDWPDGQAPRLARTSWTEWQSPRLWKRVRRAWLTGGSSDLWAEEQRTHRARPALDTERPHGVTAYPRPGSPRRVPSTNLKACTNF
jgi:hypothetical protein